MEAARFFVIGRVQGVGFRAAARNRARKLGLNGYVSNLADGRVEAFVQGELTDIEAFARWLRHGPPLARVDAVQSVDASPKAVDGFGFS